MIMNVIQLFSRVFAITAIDKITRWNTYEWRENKGLANTLSAPGIGFFH